MDINAIYCKLCNEIVHSKSVHDWVECKGKHFYTDGSVGGISYKSMFDMIDQLIKELNQ